MAAEAYGLELNTLLSVGQLQGKEGPVVTHVVNFIPPTQPIKAQWEKESQTEKHILCHGGRKNLTLAFLKNNAL